MASRKENALKVSERKQIKTRRMVFGCLTKMQMLDEKITSVTVAEALNISRTTASKYIKEFAKT